MNRPNLRLLILSDGRAGHVSTSRGMAELIRSARPSTIDLMEVRLRAKFLRPLLKWLLNSGLACRLLVHPSARRWPSLFYRGYDERAADVIISAGGDTLYLNALLGHCQAKTNFFCGSMRGVDPGLFSLIVHTRHSELPNWRGMAILPIALDRDRAKKTAEEFSQVHLGGARENLWALMIGGSGNGYHFCDADIVTMLEQCTSLAAQYGKTLLITTSRRTGPSAETAIANWLANHPEAPVIYTVLYGQRPEKIAAAFMRLSEIIFCTEESTSMISESVFFRRPVVTLAPQSASPVLDQREFLAILSERQHIHRMPIGQANSDELAKYLSKWREYGEEEHRELQSLMLAEISACAGT